MNHTTATPTPPNSPLHAFALLVVVLFHCSAILFIGLAQPIEPAAPPITPPSIMASLIAPNTTPQPVSTTPQSKPIIDQKKHAKPQHITPAPTTPAVPTSKQHEQQEATTQNSTVQTPAVAPTHTHEAPQQTAQNEHPPITPPRTEASHHNNPAPRYPAMSRRLGEQGKVLLNVHIMPDGSVSQIKLHTSSGFPRLDEAAIETVAKWKYIPAKQGNEPIAFWYKQPISFVLNSN